MIPSLLLLRLDGFGREIAWHQTDPYDAAAGWTGHLILPTLAFSTQPIFAGFVDLFLPRYRAEVPGNVLCSTAMAAVHITRNNLLFFDVVRHGFLLHVISVQITRLATERLPLAEDVTSKVRPWLIMRSV